MASPPVASAAAASASADSPVFDALIARAKAEMLADSDQALRDAHGAEAVARRAFSGTSQEIAIITARWLQSQALMRLNSVSEATALAIAALRAVERVQPRSKLHGDLLLTAANGAAALGRTQEALKEFQDAYRIFHALNEPRNQAIALQYIGNIYQDAGDDERSLNYYKQSAETYPADRQLLLSSRNNRGIALSRLGRYRTAETEFRLALESAAQLHSALLQARILNNLARAQMLRGHYAEAQQSIERGLRFSTRPDAAGWRPILLGTAAELAFRQGREQEAVRLTGRAFAGTNLKTTTGDYREAHHAAYLAYKEAGDVRQAMAHLEAFMRLDNKARALSASTNAALMAARFDFANQDLRIAKLKAGQLQRDVALARAKARQNLILFSALLTLAAVIVSLLALNMRSIRRSRNTIRAANDNLTLANAALEKALLAKTQFLATTSHEIRTPLNGILGMTQVMLADSSVAPAVRERVALVHGAGETMRALVDDILDIAKMETGNLEVHAADMDLETMLRETVTFWRGQGEAKGLTIALDAAPGLPRRIVEDQARLKQIVFNLMANGIKFTQEGAVTLHASVEGEGEAERLVLAVQDSGIGIPESAFEDIFEKFKQLDGGTNRRFGGTGLGLAICRNLAIALGGSIAVSSEVGVGSTFRLSLPLRRVAVREAVPEGQAAGGGLSASALVLVGANLLAQSVLRATLEKEVARFDIAADWTEADALLAGAGDNAVVLADGSGLQAEGEEGLARLRAFLAAVSPRALRIALLWPAPDEAMRATLTGWGADGIIAKPVTGAELVRQLRAIAAPEVAPRHDVWRAQPAA